MEKEPVKDFSVDELEIVELPQREAMGHLLSAFVKLFAKVKVF